MALPCPSDPPDTSPEDAVDDAAFYRRVLHELIVHGSDVARVLRGAVVGELAPADAGEPVAEALAGEALVRTADAFERVSRGVRRAVALARRLDEPVAGGRSQRVAARREIIRAVEDRIKWAASFGPLDTEGLEAEFAERMDMADLEDDIRDRPVADIVADICNDLGLSDLGGRCGEKRRRPSDIAALCARAERPLRKGARQEALRVVMPEEPGRVFGTNRFRRE